MKTTASERINAGFAAMNGKAKRSSTNRWARFNQFVDVTMRKLKPSESAVWVYLYRHERNGTADASVRQIAEATGLHRNVAHRALQQLIELGLVEVLRLSRHHGEASVYRLNPEAQPSPVG
ncbi:MAG: helix-turn-helix domain-containing protein [Planctomycetota bacterium]